MASNRIKSKVIVPHNKKCFAKNSKNTWSGIPDKEKPYYWGNWAANESEFRNNHLWIRILCNDPNCPAIKAVHNSVLIKA